MLETPKFKSWHRIAIAQACGEIDSMKEIVNKKVDGMMKPENLRVEIREGGKWIELDDNNTTREV